MILAHEFIKIIPSSVKRIVLVSTRYNKDGTVNTDRETWFKDELGQLSTVLQFGKHTTYVYHFAMCNPYEITILITEKNMEELLNVRHD